MFSSSGGPFPRRQPAFVGGEPVNRARHDVVGDGLVLVPLTGGGIEKTQGGLGQVQRVGIDMRQGAIGSPLLAGSGPSRARSLRLLRSCRRTRMAHISRSLSGAFWPTILPLFQGTRRRLRFVVMGNSQLEECQRATSLQCPLPTQSGQSELRLEIVRPGIDAMSMASKGCSINKPWLGIRMPRRAALKQLDVFSRFAIARAYSRLSPGHRRDGRGST